MPLVCTPSAPPIAVGNVRMVFGTMSFDNSYPTGGETVALTELGLSQVTELFAFPSQQGIVPSYVKSTNKVMAFRSDNPNAAITNLIEVANAADLSAVTGVPFIAFGR